MDFSSSTSPAFEALNDLFEFRKSSFEGEVGQIRHRGKGPFLASEACQNKPAGRLFRIVSGRRFGVPVYGMEMRLCKCLS